MIEKLTFVTFHNMKYVSILITLAIGFATIWGTAEGQPEHPLLIIPGVRIGPMVLNAPASRVTKEWGAPRQRPARQGNEYRWWEYPEYSAWMLVYKGRIVKIGVESRGYVTPEGFGVGSKARYITLDYGPGKRRRAIPWNERKDARSVDVRFEPHKPPERYFIDYPQRGISFLVDTALDIVVAVHVYPKETVHNTQHP